MKWLEYVTHTEWKYGSTRNFNRNFQPNRPLEKCNYRYEDNIRMNLGEIR